MDRSEWGGPCGRRWLKYAIVGNTDNSEVHVLAIDDDAMLLRAPSDYLIYAGYQLTACHFTGPGALDLDGLRETGAPPGVNICDYRLPGDQNGIDIITAIRGRFDGDIPAILFTGDVNP